MANIQLTADPGNSFATATNLGDLENSICFSDSINLNPFIIPLDLDDFYRFDIDSESEVTIYVGGVDQKIDVDFLSCPSFDPVNDCRIFLDAAILSNPLSQTVTLEPGDYYLKIFTFNVRSSEYEVILTNHGNPEDVGNAITSALEAIGGLDRDFYRTEYDIGNTDPLTHYVQIGSREPYSPRLLFDSKYYLDQNQDVKVAFEKGLVRDLVIHYVNSGAKEGRDPSACFDTDYYLNNNPDVAAAGINPLGHYIKSGRFEGRNPIDPNSPNFSSCTEENLGLFSTVNESIKIDSEIILLREDFSSDFDITNDDIFELDSSFIEINPELVEGTALEGVVGTQLRVDDDSGRQMGLPTVIDVVDEEVDTALRLRLDTYNPSAFTRGDSFFGTGIKTIETFNRGDGGLAVEARVRVVDSEENPLARGIIDAVFLFTPGLNIRDEIDFELLSNFIDDAQNNDSEPKIFTNIFDDDSIDPPTRGDFEVVGLEGFDLTEFNTFRIEWLEDRVVWKVNDIIVREEFDTLPDDDMAVFLNTWANGFPEAIDDSLIPANNLQSNQTFFYDIGYVQVEALI